MILTGIGNVDTSKRNIAGSALTPGTSRRKKQRSQRPGVRSREHRRRVDRQERHSPRKTRNGWRKVNGRWLGAQYDDFRGCSQGADLARRRPGVVVLAVEPDKADIILEALHLINVLIVSRQLAEKLASRLL